MKLQVRITRSFSIKSFFSLKWNSVDTLQHPHSISCEHYVGPRRNLWPLPFPLFGVGIEHPDCFSPALESVPSLSHALFLSPMCFLFHSRCLPLVLLQNRLPLLFLLQNRYPLFCSVPIPAFRNGTGHREMKRKRRNNCSHFCSMT